MNNPQNMYDLQRFRRLSRQAAFTSIIAALLVGTAFAYGIWSVYQLERQIKRLRNDITGKRDEIVSLTAEAMALRSYHQEVIAGLRNHYAKEYISAMRHYDVVLRYVPKDFAVQVMKANSLAKVGQYSEAEALVRQAISVITHTLKCIDPLRL